MAEEPVDVLVEDVRRLVQQGEPAAAARRLHQANTDILELALPELSEIELAAVLQAAPPEIGAELIERLDPTDAAELLKEVRQPNASDILDELDLDEAVPVLEEMSPAVAAAVADEMASDDAKAMLADYAEGTAGRLLTPHPFHVGEDLTVADAIDALRRAGRAGQAITYLYVVDADGHLIGVASLRDAVIARRVTSMRAIMRPFPISVHVDAPEEECVRLFLHYRFLGLPVLDDDAHLVGVIRADRLLRQADEEAEDDLLGMFGVSDASDTETVGATIRHRLPWLATNLATAFLAASVVGLFQTTIQAVVALAIFMPVVAGQGGNAGVQALAVRVRALAVSSVDLPRVWRALRHELAASLVNGTVIGAIAGVVAGMVQRSVSFGAVVGVAMVGVMVAAAAAGTLVPLGLRAVGQDPAAGSGVIVTMVTDIIGFLLLLGLATATLQALQ